MHITEKVATAVGAPLRTAEHSWMQAMMDGASLMAAVAQAGIEAAVPISVVSEIFDRNLEGLSQLGATGRCYANLHSRLSALAKMAGLDPRMYGESYVPSATVLPFERQEAA